MLGGLPTIGGAPIEGIKLITGPLYHSGPFNSAFQTILAGGSAVLMRRFDAAIWGTLVAKHRCDWSYLVPTMMKRIWELPSRPHLDLSSLQAVMHTAAPCPPWLKEEWCHWLGPEKIFEMYGMSEGLLFASIRGDEWLRRKRDDGTNLVGLLGSGTVRVLDSSGQEVPFLTMGEIWMKSSGSYTYIGAASQSGKDNWESVGDMGLIDKDGYLYLGDRKKDMLLVGGVNIFPAEVEAAVEQHPAISSAAVIGLPDSDLGQRLHAIIHLATDVSDKELYDFVALRISKQKIPRTWERVNAPVRGDDGKIRRSALTAERSSKL
jgi:bile acid-coenzyme A ligase